MAIICLRTVELLPQCQRQRQSQSHLFPHHELSLVGVPVCHHQTLQLLLKQLSQTLGRQRAALGAHLEQLIPITIQHAWNLATLKEKRHITTLEQHGRNIVTLTQHRWHLATCKQHGQCNLGTCPPHCNHDTTWTGLYYSMWCMYGKCLNIQKEIKQL